MKLKKLLKDIPVKQIKGSKELDITGVCSNSKLVAPGNLFIARKGKAEDGSVYIPEAISAGAVAILTDIYDPLMDKEVTQIICEDTTLMEGMIASQYYEFPCDELFLVGITGTNGKTTTSFLVKHLLDHLGSPCGLIGTIEYIIGQHRYQATRTTPDAPTNQKMLREMVKQGCTSGIMEVTSHALDQNRVDFIDFDVAIFTNLTVDHMDYHHSMEKYSEAKNKLFRMLNPKKKKVHITPKTAIVNIDSPWHQQMIAGCAAKVITYGLSPFADLTVTDVKLTSDGTSCVLKYREQSVPLNFPLVGKFNLQNCLAAVAVGLVKKIPLEKIAETLESAPTVPGRLEAVPNTLGLKIYVDFAHSPDALQNVLETLGEFKVGRLIVVFGCGGNRDATKRPKMAKVCEQLADLVVVTTDNPRNEDPQEILREVVAGFEHPENHLVEPDRYLAIEKAIENAAPEDVILIAGKGHEPYQIFAHQTVEFDDRKVASQICSKRAESRILL